MDAHRANKCGSKVRYLGPKAARSQVAQMRRRIGTKESDRLNVYQCPYCGFYHVGRSAYEQPGERK